MSMSKIILTGGAVAGLGALGAVALESNTAPKPAAASGAGHVVQLPPEIRTVTVTRVVHRVRHEHAAARPAVPAAAAVPRAVTRAPAARPAPLRTSSSPAGGRGEREGADDHEREDQGSHGDD